MPPPDLFRTPEQAIVAFERVTGLHVVIHDLGSTIWPFLSPERMQHRTPVCTAVKATHDWACMDFEMNRLRKELPGLPHGRYHCCHAGLMEWVVPVYPANSPAWILFAGQRRTAGAYTHLHRDLRTTHSSNARVQDIPDVTEQDAQFILEALRQLRARLLQWYEGAAEILRSETSPDKGPKPGIPAHLQPHSDNERFVSRRFQIERFIFMRHTGSASISDLARELHLSESRTIHLVRELFATSYAKMLNEMRLRTAASLLRSSSLTILEVGLSSGFQDASNFHRRFRNRFGISPLQYRKDPAKTV
ncbi:MAG: helix-turn-helix domain-containing protein [Candidatus Methylacidiphilales bacterium]